MARQKKIVPYVHQTPFMKDSGDDWTLLWEQRDRYTLQDMMEMVAQTDKHDGNKNYGNVDYFNGKFECYLVNEENWRTLDAKGNPEKPYVLGMLRRAYKSSTVREELNSKFMAEYNSRADLQELYTESVKNCDYYYDRWGNLHHGSGYYGHKSSEVEVALIEQFRKSPSCYEDYRQVAYSNNGKQFLEKNRETPFEPGDLVKLRSGYIDHPDHDPLWVSRYNAARTGAGTPGKNVERIGTVMKVTDKTGWRGTKGSKQIEVLWFGQEETVHVPEKTLRWHERPTFKNGLKKRE